MGNGVSFMNNQKNESAELNMRFKVNYLIGNGATATVMKATDQQNDIPVGLKRIDLTTSSPCLALKSAQVSLDELRAFKRIGLSPFIVSLHAAYRFKSSCYLVMDYLGGGDLRRYLKAYKTFDEVSVAYLLGCIGSALHHLHSQGVIHRDLKPENICFDLSGIPYLTDFGISIVSSKENLIPVSTSSSGTLAYMAPEILSPTCHHSHQADFWSLGIVAYELLFGQRPFQKQCPNSLMQFSVNEYYPMWKDLAHASLPTTSSSIDFDSIYIKSKTPNRLLVFPLLGLQLNEDGSTPDTLKVPLPPSSEEFTAMLNGLLDVRIPARLGNLNKYSEFSNHSLFQKHDLISPQLHRIPSPFSSFIEPLPPWIVLGGNARDDEPSLPLSTEVNLKLSEFHFTRPPLPSKPKPFRKTEAIVTVKRSFS